MEVILDGVGTLTDEHELSSHGVPVLLVEGKAHGPRELVGELEPTPAWKLVKHWMDVTDPEGGAREMCEAFVWVGEAADSSGMQTGQVVGGGRRVAQKKRPKSGLLLRVIEGGVLIVVCGVAYVPATLVGKWLGPMFGISPDVLGIVVWVLFSIALFRWVVNAVSSDN